jgi:hypothetical protein
MRTSIVLTGFAIIVIGFLLDLYLGITILVTGTIGLINIILGLATPKAPGVNLQPQTQGPVKLIVDKAATKGGTYELVFSDTRLVLKKLVSQGAIAGVAIMFAVIGGIVGGLTGFSLGEYLMERKRNKIHRENTILTATGGDLEIPYETTSQIELTGNSLKMMSGGRQMILRMNKKYPAMIANKLMETIPRQYWIRPATTVS